MALVKQPININFSKGLDLKNDPFQVPIGSFLRLENSVFTVGGRMTKRNGFPQLTAIPQAARSLTTFNGNLTAIGDSIQSLVQGTNQWVNKGTFYPVALSTLPLLRNSSNQTQCDSVTSSNNLTCVVYTETNALGTFYKYSVFDSITGQNVLTPALIPSAGTVTNAPRVFLLGNFFVIVFGSVISAVNHLQFTSINVINPVAPSIATDISTQFSPSSTLAFDGYVYNGQLYLVWNGSDGGGAIRYAFLDTRLVLNGPRVIPGFSGAIFSAYTDISQSVPYTWFSFWNSSTHNAYAFKIDAAMNVVLSPIQFLSSTVLSNLTSTAIDGGVNLFYEIPNNYTYDSSIPSHYIQYKTISSAGTVSSASIVDRSIGIASKAFIYLSESYLLSVYSSDFQPTYFLIKQNGNVVSKLAYSNGSGYLTHGLPSALMISDTEISFAYLFKDLVEAVNKSQGATNTAGVYSQTGINQATIEFEVETVISEIASSLNLTGGFPWMYDGIAPVEQGFFVWPDSIEATNQDTGGSMAAQDYFYQVTYEWTDNQGNIHRSAPSIPLEVDLSSSMTSTNKVTLNIPTLRLTYKRSNPVVIVVYRWSQGQQNYFQVTSISTPLFNDPTVDSVQFIDTQADSAILGNSLIYTTGGIIENIQAPGSTVSTLFDSRYWILDAEDRNLAWYSKPILEGTPVEMSDLFTYYVAPNIASQGSTGSIQCMAPMDDKLIWFKKDAMYYTNGVGPDATGANSQYSQPIFITSSVGCSNQQSIILMKDGLMFESDKGIWLLRRDLSTTYIGSPVEALTTGNTVESAVDIPGTTQVRFTMSNGITLMYDYFYEQWGTFIGIPGISATLYQSLHTYVNSSGQVFQEQAGTYLDGGNPVLQAFTTSWISTQGLTGFQRTYWMYLIGTYKSPHKLNITVNFDFDVNEQQITQIIPSNSPTFWGSDANWGSSAAWGGSTNLEEVEMYFKKQKCQSIQVSVDEVFDASFGTTAGEGLNLSGINLTIGTKKTSVPLPATQRFG